MITANDLQRGIVNIRKYILRMCGGYGRWKTSKLAEAWESADGCVSVAVEDSDFAIKALMSGLFTKAGAGRLRLRSRSDAVRPASHQGVP
jgi:hypothetical protein